MLHLREIEGHRLECLRSEDFCLPFVTRLAAIADLAIITSVAAAASSALAGPCASTLGAAQPWLYSHFAALQPRSSAQQNPQMPLMVSPSRPLDLRRRHFHRLSPSPPPTISLLLAAVVTHHPRC